MRAVSLLVLLFIVALASADNCYVLKKTASKLSDDTEQCIVHVIEGDQNCAEHIKREPGRIEQCINALQPPSFTCACSDSACPDSESNILKMLHRQLSAYEIINMKKEEHPLHSCLGTATFHNGGSSVDGGSSESSLPAAPSSPLPSDSPSTSPPSSSSAVPGSSPSEQTTAQEPMTSEQATDSTSPSQPAVVESSTVDEALEEITSKHPFQDAATTLENTYATMPFSTSTMTTAADPEADEGKPTDLTWLYISLGILLALVLMVAIGGLGFKLGKKSGNDTKQKVERKSTQIQQGPIKGAVPRPTDVRINMPEAAPSTPVVVTALPVPDQHTGTTGTSGTSGTSNTDEDLNTAGSTITECEISTSTTMTEEMTGGSGTSGL